MTGWRQGVNTEGEPIRDFFVEKDDPGATAVADDGMTRQEFKDECDINVLMATYEKNGSITHFNMGTPQYLDVSDVPDLPTAIAYMDAAERAFMTLPASVRREFDNSAVQFVEFAQDPSNLSKMREWGLARPQEVAEEPVVPVVTSSPSVAPGSS